MNILPRSKSILLAITTSLLSASSLLAQSANDNTPVAGPSAAGGGIGGLIGLVIAVIVIVAMWKVFVKAGQPGWASIIPIYNTYIMCKIAGKPGWWVIMFFVPLVNIIFAILLMVALAKSFGKGAGFAVGLLLLGFVFFPILGFGDATYQGAAE